MLYYLRIVVIMFFLMSAVELVGVKIWYVKALEMRMRKLVLDFSLAQILPEKINKMLSPNNFVFIDVNQTVALNLISHLIYSENQGKAKNFYDMKNGEIQKKLRQNKTYGTWLVLQLQAAKKEYKNEV